MKRIMIFFLLMGIATVGFSALHKSNLAAKSTSLSDGEEELPDGVVAVEYIESTGTQYINTLIKSSSELTVTIDLIVYSGMAFGTYLNPYQFACDTRNSSGYWRIDGATIGPSFHYDNVNRWKIKLCKDNPQLNGVRVGSLNVTRVFDNGGDMYIFAASSYSTKMKGRVFSFSIELNGNSLCDFQPVRFLNESDVWEGAMYDRVTGEVFRNQGTGSFIIGPDVK